MHLTFFPFSQAAFKAVSSLDAPTACLCMFGSLNESSQKNITKAQTEHVEALSIVWSFIKKIGNISSSVFQPAPEKIACLQLKFLLRHATIKRLYCLKKNLLYTSLSLCLSASVTPVGGTVWLCAFSAEHSAYYRLVGQDSLLSLGLIYWDCTAARVVESSLF